jgi:hypothetical protein
MLHIHNGDSAAGTFKEFGFPGEHKAFQEGPTPGGLPREEWIEVRAKFPSSYLVLNPPMIHHVRAVNQNVRVHNPSLAIGGCPQSNPWSACVRIGPIRKLAHGKQIRI